MPGMYLLKVTTSVPAQELRKKFIFITAVTLIALTLSYTQLDFSNFRKFVKHYMRCRATRRLEKIFSHTLMAYVPKWLHFGRTIQDNSRYIRKSMPCHTIPQLIEYHTIISTVVSWSIRPNELDKTLPSQRQTLVYLLCMSFFGSKVSLTLLTWNPMLLATSMSEKWGLPVSPGGTLIKKLGHKSHNTHAEADLFM